MEACALVKELEAQLENEQHEEEDEDEDEDVPMLPSYEQFGFQAASGSAGALKIDSCF